MSRRQQTLLSLWAASGRIDALFCSSSLPHAAATPTPHQNRCNTTVMNDENPLRNNSHNHDRFSRAIRAVKKRIDSSTTHTPEAVVSSFFPSALHSSASRQAQMKSSACARDITNVDTDIEDCDDEEDDNIAKSSVHVTPMPSPFPALEKGTSSKPQGNNDDEEKKKELRVFRAVLDELQHPLTTAIKLTSSTIKFTIEVLTIGQALCELCAKVLSSLTQLIKALNERHPQQGSSSSVLGSSSDPPLPPPPPSAPAILRMEPFLDHFFALSAHLLRAMVAVPKNAKGSSFSNKKEFSSSVRTIAAHLADTHPKLMNETQRFFRAEFVRLVSLNRQQAGWSPSREASPNNNQYNNEKGDELHAEVKKSGIYPNSLSNESVSCSLPSYTLAIDKDSNSVGRAPLIFTISILSALSPQSTEGKNDNNNADRTKAVSSRDRSTDIFGGPISLAKTIELLVRFLVTSPPPPPPSYRGTTSTNGSVSSATDGQSEPQQHHPTELSLKRVEVSEHYATASMAAVKALRELFVLKQATTNNKKKDHHHCRSETLFPSIESCSWIHLPPFSTLPCDEATNAATTIGVHNAHVSTSQAFNCFLTQRAPTSLPPQLGKELQNDNTTSYESSPSAALFVSCGSNSADEFFINVVVRHMLYGTLLPSLANKIRSRLEKETSGELSQQLSGRNSAISQKPTEAAPSGSCTNNDDLVQSLFREECANAVEVNSMLWVLEACCWVVEDGADMQHGEGSGGGFLVNVLLSGSSSSKDVHETEGPSSHGIEIPQIPTATSLFSKRVVPALAFMMDVTRAYLLHVADVDASTILPLTVVPSFINRIVSAACRPVADLLGALGKIDVQRTAQKLLAEVSSSGGGGNDSESIDSIITLVESTRKRILESVYEQTLVPPQSGSHSSATVSPNTSLAWKKVGTIVSGILGMTRYGYIADSAQLTNALVFSDDHVTTHNSSSDDHSLRYTAAPTSSDRSGGGFGGGGGGLLLLAAEDPATGCSYAARGDVTTAVLISSLMKATFVRNSTCIGASEQSLISSGEFTPTFWPTSLWGGITKNNFSLSSSASGAEKQPNMWRGRHHRMQQATTHHQRQQLKVGGKLACAVQYTFSCGFAPVTELLRKYFQSSLSLSVSDTSFSISSSTTCTTAPAHGGRCPSASSHSSSPSIHETLYYEDGGTARGDSLHSNPTPQSVYQTTATKGQNKTNLNPEDFSVYAHRLFYSPSPFFSSSTPSQQDGLTGAHQLVLVGELHLLEGEASLFSMASSYHPKELEQCLQKRRHQIHSEIFTAVDPSISSLTNSFIVCHWLRASLVNVAASVSSSASPSARCSELLFQYICEPSITARLSLPKRVLEGVLAWQAAEQKKTIDRNRHVPSVCNDKVYGQGRGEAQVPVVVGGDDGMLLCRSSTEIQDTETNDNFTGRNSGTVQQERRGATPTSTTITHEPQRKRNSFELPPSRRMSLNLGSLILPRPSEKFDLGGEIANAFTCKPSHSAPSPPPSAQHQSCTGISSSSVSSSVAIRSVPADQMMSNILMMSQNTTQQLLLNKEVYSQRKTEELKTQQQPQANLQGHEEFTTGAGFGRGGFNESHTLHVDPTLVENTMNNNDNNFDTYCDRELSSEHDGRESERECVNDVAETQQWAAVNDGDDDFYERRTAADAVNNPYHTLPSHRDGYGQKDDDEEEDRDNASTALVSIPAELRTIIGSNSTIKKSVNVIREDDDDDILVFASPLRRQKKGSGGASRGGEGTGVEKERGGGGRALLGGVCVAGGGDGNDDFTCNSAICASPQGLNHQNNIKINNSNSSSNNYHKRNSNNMSTVTCNHHPHPQGNQHVSSHLFPQSGVRSSTPSPSGGGVEGMSVNTTLVVNNMSRENSSIGTMASSVSSSSATAGGGSSSAHQKGVVGEQPRTAAASLSSIPIIHTSSSSTYNNHQNRNLQPYTSLSSSPFLSNSIMGLEQLISGMKAHAADYDQLQSSLAEAQTTAKRLAEENNQLRRKFQREVQNLKQDNAALQDQLETSKKESLQASAHFANEMMAAMNRLEERNKRVAELESKNISLANRVKRQEAKTMQMLSMLNSE